MALLYPEDVDQRLSWPLGRAAKLARQRRLPHFLLPDGSIRFRWEEIEPLILAVPPSAGNATPTDGDPADNAGEATP